MAVPILETCKDPIQTDPKEYCCFYRQASGKIIKETPLKDLSFTSDHYFTINKEIFLSRMVSLPGDRVFIIGGAQNIDGDNSCKETYEL